MRRGHTVWPGDVVEVAPSDPRLASLKHFVPCEEVERPPEPAAPPPVADETTAVEVVPDYDGMTAAEVKRLAREAGATTRQARNRNAAIEYLTAARAAAEE